MKTAIIYRSKYGATKTYAQWLAEDLGARLLCGDQVKPEDLTQYDCIIYGGGLYAGGVNGFSLITKNFELLKAKSLYLFTVGAADVTDPENIKNIRANLNNVMTPAMAEKISIYHFRGGMCYSRMSLIHRAMMSMMLKVLRKKPESERKAEDKVMLEAYVQDTDFTDRQALQPLVDQVRSEQ